MTNSFSWVVVITSALALSAAVLPTAAQDADSTDTITQPESITFPRTLESDAGTVVVYTPQIDTWQDFATIEARLAVEVTPAGEDAPVYGVAEFTADTDPNLELRVVAIENAKITVTSFPVSDAARREQLDAIVRSAAQSRTHYVPLDVILTYIAPSAGVPEEEGLSFEPPPIFYSEQSAILVMTDGEPVLAPLPDTELLYVVNTNWDLFRYKDREWYLRNGDHWLKNDELSGNWRFDKRLPGDFDDLPDDGNWDEVKAAIPPAKADGDEPVVFVSDRPAELILIDGKANYGTAGNFSLQYITNTESDVFRYQAQFYYLVSGRWFRAQLLRGPWEHVQELPEVFAEIDPNHAKGHVLAAVPGTDEARLAVLEASIPRKATVNRDAGGKVNVFFQGEPEFEVIEGTTVERAVNSPNDILKVGEEYYLCDNAVWYVAMSTDGPWVVADAIPAVIYNIPPSSPSYHVTHVHVYESDETSVSTGYTSGYFGIHVGFGIAMYGSGWYYPSYYGYYPYGGYPYYPYYYPYPYSYGGAAWYNPSTGMYGRSAVAYGPYGGYGRAASYNPRTGTYARGQAVWDDNEIAGSGIAYNPRTGNGIATNRYSNKKGGWGESLITHNDKWIETQSEWDKNSRSTEFRTSEGTTGQLDRQVSGNQVDRSGEFQRGDQSLSTRSVRNDDGTVIGAKTGEGTGGAIGRSSEGDLYAGKDGNVYRRDENGWQQNSGDGWSTVEVPDERAAQFDQARSSAADRRDSVAQSSADRQSRIQDSGFASSYGTGRASESWSNRTYDSSRNRSSFDSNRRAELNRSMNARSSGYDRYNSRSAAGGINRSPGTRQIQRRRR
jgi:hypothetical protein